MLRKDLATRCLFKGKGRKNPASVSSSSSEDVNPRCEMDSPGEKPSPISLPREIVRIGVQKRRNKVELEVFRKPEKVLATLVVNAVPRF